jgi:predicted  nucleic acid-binding Zn-ribbon protein
MMQLRRLIEVLESVNENVYPSSAVWCRTLAKHLSDDPGAVDAITADHIASNLKQHQSQHLQDLGRDAYRYLTTRASQRAAAAVFRDDTVSDLKREVEKLRQDLFARDREIDELREQIEGKNVQIEQLKEMTLKLEAQAERLSRRIYRATRELDGGSHKET